MKQRIVVISTRFIYPVIGGDRLRIYEICKFLSKFYDIHIFCLTDDITDLHYNNKSDIVFRKIYVSYLSKKASYFNVFRSIFNKLPLQVHYYYCKKFAKKIRNYIKIDDLILCHLVRSSEYVKDFPNTKVLEYTDAISLNYSRVILNSEYSGLMGLIYKLEFYRLRNYECHIHKLFSDSVFVSNNDLEYLKNYTCITSNVISNGVMTSDEISPCGCKDSMNIVFIGNLYSVQNLDMCYYFINKILPYINNNNNFTFKIVGQVKKRDKLSLESFRNVHVCGKVKSVSLSVQNSFVGVCPTRQGAGIQNKILEYMSYGIPALCSSTSFDAFDSTLKQFIFKTDKPDDYLKIINNLKNGYVDYHNHCKLAKNFIRSNYTWNIKLQKYPELFKDKK